MSCQRCGSARLLCVNGKTSDLCHCTMQGTEHEGYVPSEAGIGGGDYLIFRLCLNCGQMQGEYPKFPAAFENQDSDKF